MEHSLLFYMIFLSAARLAATVCVNIEECPAAMKYIDDARNQKIHSSSIEILHEAYCGSTGTEKKVHCEKIPPCYEPTDRNFCVKPGDCCVVQRLLKLNVSENAEAKKKMRQFKCNTGGEIKVKCTSLLEIEETLLASDGNVCVTPSGVKGRCIAWESCPTFSGKPLSPNLLEYLKRSICDKKNRKICCGSEEDVNNICGVDNSSTKKISGGEKTSKNEFPWMAILEYSDPEMVCGGTLINSQFVLTAAHCIRSDLKNVRIGGNYHSQERSDFQKFDVISRKAHPNYKKRPMKFDIALLKIQKVTYQDNIKWICLAPVSDALPEKFVVAGNGNTENGTLSKFQMKATIPYVEASRCQRLYRSHLDRLDLIICAGGDLGIDSCPGDSGGPLMSQVDNSTWLLHGIVSGGMSDCTAGVPGFYTRVDLFLDWIDTNMKNMLN